MKKLVVLVLGTLLCFTLAGCSASPAPSDSGDDARVAELEKQVSALQQENETLKAENEALKADKENSANGEEKDAPEEEGKDTKTEVKEIKLGDTIKTEDIEVTVNNIELSFDVLPENVSGFYSHYEADSGTVYIDVDVDVKNLQKQNLYCDEIMQVEADYNDGFSYSAFAVVEDSSTGFTYSNITSIKPLETMGMRYLINCPQEVEESDNPLFITLDIAGELYKYTIR